jgi:hypothetical protein
LNVKISEQRKNRAELSSLAKPQTGVDALKGKFPRPTTALPEVMDKNAERLK